MQLLGKEVPGLLVEESGIEAAEIWLQVGQQPTWEKAIPDCAWKSVDHCYVCGTSSLLRIILI